MKNAQPQGERFGGVDRAEPDVSSPRQPAGVPMRTLNRPVPKVELRHGADGALYVTSSYALEPPKELVIDFFSSAAATRPDGTFLAQRGPDRNWRRLTYAQALRDTTAVATWFIRNGFGPQSPPAMILSENSIEYALVMFGALRAGVTVVPVSPGYSLDGDFARLDFILDVVQPGFVYAQTRERYAAALARAAAPGRHIVTASDMTSALLRDVDEHAVAERRQQITGDMVAKILFTSGSTGQPKGVINTYANLIMASQMGRQVAEPPDPTRIYTILDWLPWHHTFGGNVHLNGVLRSAGTMYIDDGRPLPGRFDETVENLREISPSAFASVPAAYSMLVEVLEQDSDLRRNFFKNLRWLSYGGALLPQALWERMQRLAAMELGERLPFGCGWGMTETAGVGMSVYWNVERTGLLGLPQPGVTLKLVPAGDRLELRVKGPHIMPGYYKNDALNAVSFDEEGFFRTGDAVRWIEAGNPISGLEFAGRVAEDFKLQSGTWVQASLLRRDLLEALQPFASDLVIAAPDRPWLGALIWLNEMAANTENIRALLADRLAAYNSQRPGNSARVARLLVLTEPLSAADGEVTDKRSINQQRVLARRAADVSALYAQPLDPRVIETRRT